MLVRPHALARRDLLGLGIEGDGHVVDAGGVETEVVTVGAPAVAPGAIGDLELVTTGGDLLVCDLVQPVGIQSHLVVGVSRIPAAAAQLFGAGNSVEAFCCDHAGGHEAQQHRKHQQPTHQLFHVFSSNKMYLAQAAPHPFALKLHYMPNRLRM